MKTAIDIYNEVGDPCYHCKYAYTSLCVNECVDPVLLYMCEIADDMILRGEY